MTQLTFAKTGSVSLGDLFPELGLPSSVASILIEAVEVDSRKVEKNYLFAALKGASFNGEDYIEDAIKQGAAAVVLEGSTLNAGLSQQFNNQTVILGVENLAQRISHLSGLCLGWPSRHLQSIAVTGTNGKSTCVSLIAQLFGHVGKKTAAMGTLGLSIDGNVVTSFGMTTPDAVSCQNTLAYLVDQKVELLAMEVSSHGLAQGRVAAVDIDVAVFTNLTHDHLDYHGSIEQYREAKQKLFVFESLKVAVINLDDPSSQYMLASAKIPKAVKIYTYSLLHFVADVYVSEMVFSEAGVAFTLVSPWGTSSVKSPLLGRFNVYNVLAAITAACASGIGFDDVVSAVSKLKSVPGRMQKSSVSSDVSVVVDFAHTPDALEQVIEANRLHSNANLCVVFGCGGDRDALKRPRMAKIAERGADRIIVTSDNPRTEEPSRIVSDICAGFEKNLHRVILDRKEAIDYAISSASAGDTVLIAGKGHEDYQMIGRHKMPFDDVKVADQALLIRNQQLVQQGAL